MTIKLHGFPMSPNARRVQIALEEVGAPYEYVLVDLMQGQQRAADYVALNPNGRVPTLVDGDLVLWESHAILEYLAAKHPEHKLGGQSPAEVGEIAKWMFLNASHFGPGLAGVFAHTMRLPEDKRVPQIAENGRNEANRILKLLDGALAGKTWLVGERITNADISFAPNAMFAPMLGFDLSALANVSGWIERLKARASVKKVLG